MAHTETHTTAALGTQPPEMEQCIELCQQCAKACLELVTHCLTRGGEHAAPEHIRLLLDCADACEACVKFMIRGSDLHALYCQACADVCLRCADNCAQFQDDQTMMRCAALCRRCAESCRKMAAG